MNTKKTYLFLLAWMSGCDSSYGKINSINAQSDLLPEFVKHNGEVFALLIIVPDLGAHSEKVAHALGCERAFHQNYTGYDTFSDIIDYTGKSINFNIPTIDITE